MPDHASTPTPPTRDAVRDALNQAFREFFRVASTYDLKNPPLYYTYDGDTEFQRALDRLTDALMTAANRPAGQ